MNAALTKTRIPNPAEWVAGFGKSHGTRPEDLERVTLVALPPAPPQDSYVAVVRAAQPYLRDEFEAQLKKRGLAARQVRGRTCFGPGPTGRENVCIVSDRTFVYSPQEAALREWAARVPEPDDAGPLRPALDLAARGHHVVIGAAPPRDLRDDLVKQMQAPFPGLRSEFKLKQPDPRPLADVRTATLTADLRSRADGAESDGLDAELRLNFVNGADEAKRRETLLALRDFLAAVLKLYSTGELEGATPMVAGELSVALRTTRVEQRGPEARVVVKMEWEPAWPAAAVNAMKEEGDRIRSLINLRMLAGVMHTHADTTGHFPPAAITDKDGKPLLSWRVAVLPLLGEDELYKRFNLDEPWDGPNNKKLLARMPAVFEPPLPPKGWEPNTTFYQVFTGEQTIFPPGKTTPLFGITDGTSNTLLIVEAGEAVPWTKPQDLPYDPKQPLPMLGGIFQNGGFQAVMADGHTGRFLSKNLPPATLRALITPAGGEEVTPP
jgi:hypothetical protein